MVIAPEKLFEKPILIKLKLSKFTDIAFRYYQKGRI